MYLWTICTYIYYIYCIQYFPAAHNYYSFNEAIAVVFYFNFFLYDESEKFQNLLFTRMFCFLFINSLFISLFYSYQAPNLKPLQVSVSRQRAVFCSMKNCITKLGSFTYFSFYFFLFKLQFLWQKLLIDAYFFVILM